MNYVTTSQIDDAIHMTQMVLWRDLIRDFPKDKRVRNYLLPFEVKANVTIASKIGSLPPDFEHEIEAWYTASSVDYPVQLVESGFYRRRIRDVVDPPSTTNLFATIYYDSAKKIEVSNQVTPLVLLYFKKPTKPVFATTLSSGQYLYDDAGSTDVLWSDVWHDYLVERSLRVFGLQLREGQIERAGNAPQPKEMTK
jgi:hypothetical protein